MRNKIILFGAVALSFVVAGVLYLCMWNQNSNNDSITVSQVLESRYETDMSGEASSDSDSSPTGETLPETPPQKFYVYVCGAVQTPGVYPVTPGTRMYEAIELAGGKSPEGCLDYLELAREVQDESRIYVPTRAEIEKEPAQFKVVQSDVQPASSKQVNLNTASKEALMTLPGIGEAKANAIIQYREQNGSFQSTKDIMKIAGIKDAAYAKIKDLITV